MKPEQRDKLNELWSRGLMKIDRRCPRLSGLLDEAAAVGLPFAKVKDFVLRRRKAMGLMHWEQEDIDLEVELATIFDKMRIRHGTSIQDEYDTFMALIGSQKTGLQPPRASPSEPRDDLPGAPPVPPRPAGIPMGVGETDCGQLGIPQEQEQLLPTPVVVPRGKTIVDVAAGGLHSAFLTADGEVLSCGLNDEAQLARPDAGDQDCRRVCCGDSFTAVLDTLGRVFWVGQLRDAGGVFHDIGPRLLEVPLWAPATKIAAGAHHLAVLVGNSIATCGAADRGQLGRVRERRALKRSSRESSLTASPWTTATEFIDVCCGTYSTIGLTAADDIWGCGNNYLYQLGEGPRTIWMSRKLDALSQRNLVQVALGDDHGVALSSSGRLTLTHSPIEPSFAGVTATADRLERESSPNNLSTPPGLFLACQITSGRSQPAPGSHSVGPVKKPPDCFFHPQIGLDCFFRQSDWTPFSTNPTFYVSSLGTILVSGSDHSRGYAWGSGVSNQLCVGEEVTEVAAPVPMVGLPGPLHTISVGGQHTLTLVLVEPAPSAQ
ncbi:Regulator of chromosome condensation [Branchiostoma belcheri]|nr:Regulator of chromosome condensation [Branchiostoma belcheri]